MFKVRANPDTFESYEALPPEPQGVPGAMEDMESDNTKGHWEKRLTSFQKLMFIKVFKTEKVRLKSCFDQSEGLEFAMN